MKTAYFGAGCFWHGELTFSKQNGVVDTEVGHCTYSSEQNTDDTKKNRVEVVKVTYNPDLTSLEKLIDIFWTTHDPSNEKHKNPEYVERSVIFGTNQDQIAIAKSKLEEKKNQDNSILTEIAEFEDYKRAPDKDQQYYFRTE